MTGIPRMNIIDHETYVSGSLAAISIQVEYPRGGMDRTIEHDTLYIIYDLEPEQNEGGVNYEEALELAERLCNLNK
jgi:hypothetical protein